MIRVISKKIIKNSYHIVRVNEYTEKLTSQAKLFPGFISSYQFFEYQELDDNMDYNIYTIHEWDDVNFFNKWLESPERENIHNENKEMFKDINHTILLKKKNIYTDFLL